MATLKQRLHRKNASGTYDIIHLETSADCITGTLPISHGGTGATTAANARTNLGAAASSHNHSTSQITSGTLSVARGGTGRSTLTSGYFLRGNGTGAVTMSSIDQVKSALGIGGGGSITDPPVAPVSIPNVGGTLSWAGKTWIVVHKVTGIAFLGLNTLEGTVQFSAQQYINNYLGSKLHDRALDYAVQLKLYACDYVLDYMGGKVFVASYDQLNGDFSYFTDNGKRDIGQIYWTSSEYSNSYVWYVNDDGRLGDNDIGYTTSTRGFRPFVALRT